MTELDDTINAAGHWLLQHQDPSGGWASRPGDRANALNTAEAIIALVDGEQCKAGDQRIAAAVEFLDRHQTKNGPEQGSWPREITLANGSTIDLPDLVRTTFAIQALHRAGVGAGKSPTREALAWLFQVRDPAGTGWGYRRGAASELMPTCLALGALLENHSACAASCQQQTLQSLDWLVRTFYNEGGDADRGSFGPPGPLRGVHTIYAALVIQLARKKGIVSYHTQEQQAVQWLMRHPDAAIELREEWVQIDPQASGASQGGNYGFMFMTDTLLIRLLMDADSKAYRDSKLTRSAMLKLKDQVDQNSGAFYGSRVYSWSTAKAVSALKVARQHTSEFPKRTPEYQGPKAGPAIGAFAAALAVIGFLLIRDSQFGLLEFGYFFGLMLAALLAYGFIGEKTFKELFGNLTNLVKPKASGNDT